MTTVDADQTDQPLSAPSRSFVADPAYADTVEIERDLVSVASPTSGPNRYTLHVPTELSVLSLGAASPRWNTDLGIVGYTDSHVHFETKTGAQTVVSLGGPATTSSVKGYGGAAPVATHGYSMVTVNNAWHDAKKQHYLLSRTHDATLRTKGEEKRAVLQAESGTVDVNGGVEVNVAGGGVAMGAHAGLTFEDVKYAEAWRGETPHSIAAKRAGIFNGITNALVTAHNLVMSAAHMRKEWKGGHLHPSVDTVADVVEWLADLGEFLNTKGEVAELMSDEEATEGSVKMDAEEDFGISAGGAVGFFGAHAASLGSTVWSSVSGVVSASMKGSLFAGVAATFTSLKGYKKIEVGCDVGKVIVEAKRDASVSAEKNVIAVGKELAQVAGEKEAYFTGGRTAWIGTSAGGGWGLRCSAHGLKVGKATPADKMNRAKVSADHSITIEKNGFVFKSGSTKMDLSRQHVETSASSVKFHAKDADVRVGGAKVLIDGP